MVQDFGLVIDWETSGLPDQAVPWRTYLEGPQGIEIGAILVRLPEFEPVDEFTSRVQFLGTAHGLARGLPLYENLTWDVKAERVHGITPANLLDAPHPSIISEQLINWIKVNGATEQPLMLCGHNPSFDQYYTRQLLFIGGKERQIRLHHRMVDSFTLGYLLYGSKSSDDLFRRISSVSRKIHSAIEDARLTLDALRTIYALCRRVVNTETL
jgi:DNA polymerase III epsilon subunit-like protein